MARHPPTILSVVSTDDGGISIEWEVDTFFEGSETPDKVLIDLNGLSFQELEGDETSVEIPAATVAQLGPQVAISISFWWAGPPVEEQMSSVTVAVNQGGGAGNTGVLPAARPVVTLVRVQARTVSAPASITIAWRSNNYNDGNIFWGPVHEPTAFVRNIRPIGEVYSGEFTTDKPLSASTQYVFKVEVRNTLHSPTWISTTIVVRSAVSTLSVRDFLTTSGRPSTTPLGTVVGADKSVRKMLVG